MAVSAVYFSIRSTTQSLHSQPALSFSNISATPAIFYLPADTYCLDCIGSSYGTATLERLGPDGSTYLTAATAFSANGTETVALPAGTYKLALA